MAHGFIFKATRIVDAVLDSNLLLLWRMQVLDTSLISETPTTESSSASSSSDDDDDRGPSATLQLRAVRESLKEAAERFKVSIEAFESLEMEVAHLHRDKTNLEGERAKLHLHNNSLEGDLAKLHG